MASRSPSSHTPPVAAVGEVETAQPGAALARLVARLRFQNVQADVAGAPLLCADTPLRLIAASLGEATVVPSSSQPALR